MWFLYSFLSICALRPHTAGPFLRFKIYNWIYNSRSIHVGSLLCNGHRTDHRFWHKVRPTRQSPSLDVPCRCRRTTGCTTFLLKYRKRYEYATRNLTVWDVRVTLPTDDFLCVTNSVDAPILAAAEHASAPAWPPPTTITSYRREQRHTCLVEANDRETRKRPKRVTDMANTLWTVNNVQMKSNNRPQWTHTRIMCTCIQIAINVKR